MNGNLALKENVIGLDSDTIYNHINNFLEEKSKSTQISYKRYYKEIFMYVCGKQLNELNWNDILNISYADVTSYKLYQMNRRDKTRSNATINQMLFACKKLWEEFFMINRKVDKLVFEFKELEEKDNSYASLSIKELNNLYDHCLSSKIKPHVKYLYFKFLYIVGCRKEFPVTLTWNNIRRIEDSKTGRLVWTLNFCEKKQNVRKSISDEFYDELKNELYTDSNEDKIFQISVQTIENVFNSFREKYNLKYKNERKVCIHSIKKTSCQTAHRLFKDLVKTQKHAQHSDPKTTSRMYLEDMDDYTQQPSYVLGKNYSINSLKLDGETLYELIKKCDDEIMVQQLCMKLDEMTTQ